MPQPAPHLLPTRAGPWGKPLAMALGVHALLLMALTWGVAWKQTPTPVLDAELWSALPQLAAPEPAEPPTEAPQPIEPEVQTPPPQPAVAPPAPPQAAERPKPDIAAEKKQEDQRKAKEELAKKKQAEEKAQREKAQREKALKEKAAKEQAAKAQAAQEAQEAKRREEQRQEQLQRMMGQAGQKGSTAGQAAQSSGPSASYAGRVAARIKPNVVLTDPVAGNPRAEVEVRADAEGKIIDRKLVKSSGNAAWDQAVLRAIDRTATLPRDTDGRVPSALIIGLRPLD